MRCLNQASDKGLKLEYCPNADIPDVYIDRNVVDKVLVNLISNAIKYTHKGGNISVVLTQENDITLGKCLNISIIDTGIGLDNKTADKIFERFYQGHDNENPTKSGFGIGLDLCQRLTKLHHGKISGKNRNDGITGSVFSISLPLDVAVYSPDELINQPLAENDTSRKEIPEIVREQKYSNKESESRYNSQSSVLHHVLVVDDDKELMEYICSHLSKKYKVTGILNGNEALKIINSNPPDIVVSDVLMPGIDGLTLLKRMKSNADTHHIPVVLLSSKSDLSDRMSGWDRGADAYLGKPFNIDELEVVINNLIDNRLRIKGKFSGIQDTEGKIAPPDVKGNDEKLIERVMKIIEKFIDDPKLNVEMFSQEVGVSRAHLHRKMKEMMGITPSDFIRSVRIRRACELLQKGDIEVTQVAYLLGFTSQSHFSTTFKNLMGMTPSEYRTRHSSENIAKMSDNVDSGNNKNSVS